MDQLYTCTRCRQTTIPAELVAPTDRGGIYTVPAVCDACRGLERQPQGERMRLFAPPPAQLAGQLTFS